MKQLSLDGVASLFVLMGLASLWVLVTQGRRKSRSDLAILCTPILLATVFVILEYARFWSVPMSQAVQQGASVIVITGALVVGLLWLWRLLNRWAVALTADSALDELLNQSKETARSAPDLLDRIDWFLTKLAWLGLILFLGLLTSHFWRR
ncbi:MAG: hypothetical protein HY092_04055 [Candidatus Kerfeldbacteria bacterium]|nr:hypothetical protein [Candidatus Kerfeldbacteria bacterium]